MAENTEQNPAIIVLLTVNDPDSTHSTNWISFVNSVWGSNKSSNYPQQIKISYCPGIIYFTIDAPSLGKGWRFIEKAAAHQYQQKLNITLDNFSDVQIVTLGQDDSLESWSFGADGSQVSVTDNWKASYPDSFSQLRDFSLTLTNINNQSTVSLDPTIKDQAT